ncbi:MAG TPA: hypothetical protein VF756_12365 [Thermoanaerobaculia bacterium]
MSSSFGVYLVGFIVLILGLAFGAYLAGAPPVWIGVGVVILLGIGIVMAVTRTQAKTPPPPPHSR